MSTQGDNPVKKLGRQRGRPWHNPAMVDPHAKTADGRTAKPALHRRLLVLLSLVCLTLLIIVVTTTLLRTPAFLLGGLAGLSVAGAGGWWIITELGWRRWLGATVCLAGLSLTVVAFLRGVGQSDGEAIGLLSLALVLFVITIASARAALVRDLHTLDSVRNRSWQPSHPVLICNPKSGGGKVTEYDIVGTADALGVETVVLTESSDLEQLARDAITRGADCLGMAGGDGSQALVATIAIEHGVPFVVVSAGTRNHFAQDLGIDRNDPRAGLEAFRDGVLRDVDYATVGGRLFVNNVSLGVYAEIVEEEGYRESKLETSLTRLPDMLGVPSDPFDLQFTAPDGTEVDGAFVILVSNNPYVLGPALDVSQRRTVDAGHLGVVAVTAASPSDAALLVTRLTIGRGQNDPHLFQFNCHSFQIRSRSGHVAVGIDGESAQLPTPLEFAIHPKGLRLLVPPGAVVAAERRRARAVSVRALVDVALGRASQSS